MEASTEAGSYNVAYQETAPGIFEANDCSLALQAGGSFHYRLYSREEGSDWILMRSETLQVEATPLVTALNKAYPNPFNPATTLRFTVDSPQRMRLAVFDIAGRHQAQVADKTFDAGTHELLWQARDDAGRRLPSGVYLLRMEAAGKSETQKLVLLQ
ncbi:MAG: T9SS type A sorting domain-containing protein [Candidatus Krumholzibacteria bacterium]|nr:T9SS type A sorting domain-containing protein [Candidatus Krumholzibacteria bacterium]